MRGISMASTRGELKSRSSKFGRRNFGPQSWWDVAKSGKHAGFGRLLLPADIQRPLLLFYSFFGYLPL
jgi:hypothetical protein